MIKERHMMKAYVSNSLLPRRIKTYCRAEVDHPNKEAWTGSPKKVTCRACKKEMERALKKGLLIVQTPDDKHWIYMSLIAIAVGIAVLLLKMQALK